MFLGKTSKLKTLAYNYINKIKNTVLRKTHKKLMCIISQNPVVKFFQYFIFTFSTGKLNCRPTI